MSGTEEKEGRAIKIGNLCLHLLLNSVKIIEGEDGRLTVKGIVHVTANWQGLQTLAIVVAKDDRIRCIEASEFWVDPIPAEVANIVKDYVWRRDKLPQIKEQIAESIRKIDVTSKEGRERFQQCAKSVGLKGKQTVTAAKAQMILAVNSMEGDRYDQAKLVNLIRALN